MELLAGESVSIDGVRVRCDGRLAGVSASIGSRTVTVRGTRGDTAIADLLGHHDLRVTAAIDVTVPRPAHTRPDRDGGAAPGEPMLVLDAPPLGPGEVAQVALVEEDGELRWIFQRPGQQQFVLEPDAPGRAERGLLGGAARTTIRFIAIRAAGPLVQAGVRSLTASAERRLRPHRVRTFTPDDARQPCGTAPDAASLAGGPVLLFVHGTLGRTDHSFGSFDREWLRCVHERYDGRVIAFDHPTVSMSPAENAEAFMAWFVEHIEPNLDGTALEIDVVAHSRGGLVARELAELAPPGLVIRSIVFVATPNSGTPLCDAAHLGDLLDVATNLAAVVPDNPVTDALEIVLELMKDIALGAALAELPGLGAMDPNGTYLAELNRRVLDPRITLRAIAADFEPMTAASKVVRLRDRVFDRVFSGGMNDLVVPTRSAYLRAADFAVAADQRLVLESSHGVDHSSYWQHAAVLDQLDHWLRPDWPVHAPPPAAVSTADAGADIESALAIADGDGLVDALQRFDQLGEGFRQLVSHVTSGPVSSPPRRVDARGDVLLLPGIMGSLLEGPRGRVWISPWRLSQGAFRDLTLDHPQLDDPQLEHRREDIVATGLHAAYAPLAIRLARGWNVHLFPFDWRIDIEESARRLDEYIRHRVLDGRNARPVHLVAHSMGGLVARAFATNHRDTWARIDGDGHADGGRLVMLGTPNRGSYAIPLLLAGQDITLKGLAAVDEHHSRADLSRIVASFPGMYQLLPSPLPFHDRSFEDDRARLYDVSSWRDVPVVADLLQRARDFHEHLAEGHDDIDHGRLVHVVGDRQMTPARVRIEAGAQRFGRHDRGDGRVAHASGQLEGVDTFYVATGHGGLVSDPSVIDAIDSLLTTGAAPDLQAEPFPRRGSAAAEPQVTTPLLVGDVDPEPGIAARTRAVGVVRRPAGAVASMFDEATSLYLGTTAPDRARGRQLRVTVKHASLEQAKHPVIVGHYRGLPLDGAEAFLDHRLGGALRRHHELGDYPRDVGESLYVDQGVRNRPCGGIVVGLGSFGELTRSRLARAIRSAAVRRVLHAADRGLTGNVGISAVLISTPGQYGLSVASAVAAVLEGAAEAVLDLDRNEVGDTQLDEIQIIELYEVRATEALAHLQLALERLPVELQAAVDVHVDDDLRLGRGRRPGLPTFGGAGDGWPRFVIDRHLPPEPGGDQHPSPTTVLPRLEFTRVGRGAQVDRLSVEFDRDKVDALIDGAIHDPAATDEVYALFELLFPHQEKLEIDDTDNLHLLVDEDTASIPWELLCGRGSGHPSQALAIRSGLLRQLRPNLGAEPTRRTGRPPLGYRALVVGDPPAGDDVPRLPGARREARAVAARLERAGYIVERHIFDDDADPVSSWIEIQTALYRQPYRVVHFATHGHVDLEHPQRTGLLIGPQQRLTAVDLRQMSVTPDLVFLNACHVGRLGRTAGLRRTQPRANELAANLGLQLMRNGVRAVVAAGWAVDDHAAVQFAESFYDQLLGGQHYGVAVHEARKSALDGRTNTWGAYQCYGDPSFALQAAPSQPRKPRPVSARQLIEMLDVLAAKAGDVPDLDALRHTHGGVVELDDRHVARFRTLEVLEALGHAYGALGCYADAVWAYREAIDIDRPSCRISSYALEQLSNMEAYLAYTKALGLTADLPVHHEISDEPDELVDAVVGRLDRLITAGDTHERRVLLGSLCKKLAVVDRSRKRRDVRLAWAIEHYRAAFALALHGEHRVDPYSGLLWAQLAHLIDPDRTDALVRDLFRVIEWEWLHRCRLADDPAWLEALHRALASHPTPPPRVTGRRPVIAATAAAERDALRTLVETLPPPPPGASAPVPAEPPDDFWTDTTAADIALTRLMLFADTGEELQAAITRVVDRYTDPFENRSTIRTRQSITRHICDLATLADASCGDNLNEVVRQLRHVS